MTETTDLNRSSIDSYSAETIRILSGLEPIRVRPAMYIGAVGDQGLHQLVLELIQNAVDEAMAGHCTELAVTLEEDGSCTVEDDGRGIPVDVHPSTGQPACEVVLTTLHSGSKFGRASYPIAGGLHGVGLSCVNALSVWLTIDVWRDGAHHRQRFHRGAATGALAKVARSTRTGTRISFRGDTDVLGQCEFSHALLLERLREVAFLLPRLTTRFIDRRAQREDTFCYESGLKGFVEHLNLEKAPVHPAVLFSAGTVGDLSYQLALQWTTGYSEQILSFVNSVATPNGGVHVEGLKGALTNVLTRLAQQHKMLDATEGETLAGFDIREGLTAVLSITMPEPEFDGQTKTALTSQRVQELIGAALEERLRAAFDSQPELAAAVLGKVLEASRARLAARRASERAHYRGLSSIISKDVYRAQFGIRSSDWHDSAKWITDGGLLASHAQACRVDNDARLLDVCCGSGVVGASFRGRVGSLVGLDLTPQMVALAKARLDEVHQGDVYDMPFEHESFDIVVNREVLHLLPHPERPLQQIFRVLKPGGQFIVGQMVPFSDIDAPWMFRILKKKQPLFFNNFTAESFHALLEEVGFERIEVTEYLQWEDIDRWIDTHETSSIHRHEIRQLYQNAPAEVRAVHPFEVSAAGRIRDCWRWCIFSCRKPGGEVEQ